MLNIYVIRVKGYLQKICLVENISFSIYGYRYNISLSPDSNLLPIIDFSEDYSTSTTTLLIIFSHVHSNVSTVLYNNRHSGHDDCNVADVQ